jgi:hypothetical protein
VQMGVLLGETDGAGVPVQQEQELVAPAEAAVGPQQIAPRAERRYNVAAPIDRLSPQPSSDRPSASARPRNSGSCA